MSKNQALRTRRNPALETIRTSMSAIDRTSSEDKSCMDPYSASAACGPGVPKRDPRLVQTDSRRQPLNQTAVILLPGQGQISTGKFDGLRKAPHFSIGGCQCITENGILSSGFPHCSLSEFDCLSAVSQGGIRVGRKQPGHLVQHRQVVGIDTEDGVPVRERLASFP